MKGEIDSNTITVKVSNTHLSTMDRPSREKINKEILDLNHTLNQIDLTNVYRTFHPTKAEYTLFSSAHGTFS